MAKFTAATALGDAELRADHEELSKKCSGLGQQVLQLKDELAQAKAAQKETLSHVDEWNRCSWLGRAFHKLRLT